MIRVSWLVALSYRTEMAFGIIGLFVSVLPLYFVSGALQPMMADAIRGEGQQYFAFLMIGLVTSAFVTTAVTGLHMSMSLDISTGALEAMLATPASLPALLIGMVGQKFTWTIIRAVVLLLSAWLLGAQLVWSNVLTATAVVVLVVLAYIPVGIVAAALVLAVRTTGPYPGGVLWVSTLLGGVFYPTSVVPSWLASVSAFIPLTYGLRALRRTFIDGAPVSAILGDVGTLVVLGSVSFVASAFIFSWALSYARRAGTLAQY